MKIKELRKAIETLSDDADVIIEIEARDNEYGGYKYISVLASGLTFTELKNISSQLWIYGKR